MTSWNPKWRQAENLKAKIGDNKVQISRTLFKVSFEIKILFQTFKRQFVARVAFPFNGCTLKQYALVHFSIQKQINAFQFASG